MNFISSLIGRIGLLVGFMLFPSIISRLFDPFITVSYLIVMNIWSLGLQGDALCLVIGYIFGICVLPPALLLLVAVRKKWVSNWDLTDRRERVHALSLFSIFLCIDMFIGYQLPYPSLHQAMLYFFFLFAGFFFITLFWKLSGHMTFVTTAILLTLRMIGWMWWPILLIIPFVGWARLTLKRHTPAQVIGGVLYATCVFFLFRLFQFL